MSEKEYGIYVMGRSDERFLAEVEWIAGAALEICASLQSDYSARRRPRPPPSCEQ